MRQTPGDIEKIQSLAPGGLNQGRILSDDNERIRTVAESKIHIEYLTM